MVTKKAKSAIRRSTTLREAAPEYKARADAESLGEVFWLAFQALPEDARDAFLSKLLDDPELREDLFDSIIMIERRDEPTQPYREIREELVRDGLL